MNLTIDTGVPFLTVFFQGLLSFFSPCILPLVPLYISYLAGGTKTVDENGNVHYPRKKVMVNTIFFILGIGFAFILLGIGFTAIGRFFSGYRVWFVRAGGFIMILFGLYQLGVLGKAKAIERERRLPFQMGKWAMSPLMALLLGFTFSFAWTPCVGPVLASVLLMASSSSSAISGFLLIGVYLIGFVLPFLAVGLFTGTVLGFFKKHQGVIKYTVKVGGILLIFMGIMTITGWMNGVTGYLSSFGTGQNTSTDAEPDKKASDKKDAKTEEKSEDKTEDKADAKADAKTVPAPDFTLKDQSGETHTLSDYKGKTVFLNFWATWCGPCRQEMPHIQKIYEEYSENSGDLVVLGVANPKTDTHPKNSDVSEEEITQFMEENGYNYPVAMDTTGDIFSSYGISSFPTTFMIDAEGNVFGYVSGSLTEEMIRNIIKQTMEGKTS